MFLSNRIDDILRIGINLKEIGVKNWALTKCQALTVLDYFSLHGITVLGGDVYEELNESIQSNYDNWYCEYTSGETHEAFQIRSIEKARRYIVSYNIGENKKIYFALIPSMGNVVK